MEDFNWIGWIGHSLSGTAILGSLIGFFPPIAAVAAFVWYTIQIWESQTMRNYFARRRARRIARYRAEIVRLETLQADKDIP
jgi:hypothetical protein